MEMVLILSRSWTERCLLLPEQKTDRSTEAMIWSSSLSNMPSPLHAKATAEDHELVFRVVGRAADVRQGNRRPGVASVPRVLRVEVADRPRHLVIASLLTGRPGTP